MSRRLLLLVIAALLAIAACEIRIDGAPLEPPVADDFEVEAEVEAPAAGEDLEVPLEVVEDPGGATLAFVAVTIHGEGPFIFALDTGASHSVVHERIARDLRLEEVDDATRVTGVVGVTQARQVQVEDWSIGHVDLGARPLVAIELGAPGDGIGLDGLLGSDLLSEFDAITVDYARGALTLRPRQAS
jgi:predicted aspartyl protease